MEFDTVQKYSAGTAYFEQVKDEFDEIAAISKLLSTKMLLMDDKHEINKKFNMALSLWKSYPPSKYVIDYICTVVKFTFSYEIRNKLFREINEYTEGEKLSDDSYTALSIISEGLHKYTLDKLDDNCDDNDKIKYEEALKKYLDTDYLIKMIMQPDEEFLIDYLAPITDMPLQQINYFLTHVLKRKSIDFYNKDEFLLYAVSHIDCSFKYGLLYDLKEYYDELKSSSGQYISEDFDNSMTVFAGYYADDVFIDELEKASPDEFDDIRGSEIIKNMLLWHSGLKKTMPSSAKVRFAELYNEVNELYSEEIADFKVFKRNDQADDNADNQDDENEHGKRGEYNISNKYDGTGEIIIKYKASRKIILNADKNAFISEGRYNRVNGYNLFAPCSDIVLNAGAGVVTVRVKCTSENPFQMVKIRKNGTVEIAERDTIKLLGDYQNDFVSCEISHKPICVYFNKLKNTGTIHDYLYSELDRKDMLDEWFYDKDFLNIDAKLLNTPWFNDTRLSENAVNDFDSKSENIQRNWILLFLFMIFVKNHNLSDETRESINKSFVKTVQYEMGELRYDSISYGNPFDCLLSYLLLSDAPVDNLRLLYKEVDKVREC